MERSTLFGATAVALAWLVVLASTAGVAGPVVGPPATDAPGRVTAATPPSPTNNTSARLTLPAYRIERSQFETVTVGAASALQSGAFGARAEHRRIAIMQQFESADTVSEQRSVIDRALIDLSDRAQALEARERRTIGEYSDGNVSTETLVRRLARIDKRARELAKTLALARELAARIPTDRFNVRIRELEGTIEPLTGPVRQRVSRSLSGDATPVRVYVVASDEGLVLSMLGDGQYVREATDWRNRNASGERELETTQQARERADELYSWVVSQRGGTSIVWKGPGVWKWAARHSQGQLVAFIDASTTDVYREIQWFDVDEMPATMTIVRIRSGLRITLQRTYSGGPLRILVEDASTDAVVNANVALDGHELGRIGADGIVMTIEPEPPYTVNVTGSGPRASIRVERPLNGTEG